MTDTRIRVLVADDEELVRAALVALLEREPDIDVVATAADGRQTLERALAHRPDVAVIDLQMPVLDGISVVTELNRQLPGCAAVILTGHGRPRVLRQALTSGARGFLAKGAPAPHSPRSYAGFTKVSGTSTRSWQPMPSPRLPHR
jgi:two-component system, NarL family, response regulator DesR